MGSPTVLRLEDYDAIGFDIDHTLAKYKLPHLFSTSYRALAEYLVNEKGYDSSILEPFDKDFCTRGLVLDMKSGNFLKLGEDGTILRASHGTRMMDDAEIKAEYGEKRHWPDFEQMIDRVDNLETCRIFENFFDMPGSVLCARLVDLADKKVTTGGRGAYTFWHDLVAAYDNAYLHTQFAADKGGFFPLYKTETDKFLAPCSEEVKTWLKSLRKANKKVFVITSSFVDFAKYTMKFVLGDDWHEYFDLFLVYARKPGFFTKSRPFVRLEGTTEVEEISELTGNHSYSQGNVKQLMAYLSRETGIKEPKVLFFGDSLRSDVFPSKAFANWETVFILEEMEAEIGTLFKCPAEEDTKPGEGSASPFNKIKVAGPSQMEKEFLTSQQWGSLFTDHLNEGDGCPRFMNTLWGYIIRKYADIAIPQLEYITDLPMDHAFEVFDHSQRTQWGFFPRPPAALHTQQ